MQALLVPIAFAFVRGPDTFPAFGYPGLIDSLDWVMIVLLLAFLVPAQGNPAGRHPDSPSSPCPSENEVGDLKSPSTPGR